MLSGELLFPQSKLQNTVALSSIEAEYMATMKAGKKALWIANFFACLEFHFSSQPVDLRADNKGVILLKKNLEFYRKTKHIKMFWHWIREKVKSKMIAITYIDTKEMLADELTKALCHKMFKSFRKMIVMSWACHICPIGSV